MIVQHTDKECKTKFSIGVEFKNLLYDFHEEGQKLFLFLSKCAMMIKDLFMEVIIQ